MVEKVNYLYKQILVLRTDLKMRRGKEISQACHASNLILMYHKDHPDVQAWLNSQFAKIAVGIESEQELIELVEKARDKGIVVETITDNGNTEFNGVKTLTCAAIGPTHVDNLIGLTDHLKLR